MERKKHRVRETPRSRGAGEEEGGGVVAGAGRRDEHPALVLLGVMLVGDEGEAEHATPVNQAIASIIRGAD